MSLCLRRFNPDPLAWHANNVYLDTCTLPRRQMSGAALQGGRSLGALRGCAPLFCGVSPHAVHMPPTQDPQWQGQETFPHFTFTGGHHVAVAWGYWFSHWHRFHPHVVDGLPARVG